MMTDEETLMSLQEEYFSSEGRIKELAFNKMYNLIKVISVKMIKTEMYGKGFYIDGDMIESHSIYITYRTLRIIFYNKKKRIGFLPIIYKKTYETLHNIKQRRINMENYNWRLLKNV